MRKKFVLAGVIVAVGGLVGLGFSQQGAQAMGKFSAEDSNYIKKDEVIDGSAYLAGKSVTVEGTIKGDLYCAGENVVISGNVEGDILCAGMKIEITGTSKGDMRLAGDVVNLRGTSGGNVSVASNKFDTEATMVIAGDLVGGASNVRLAGKIGRDVLIGSESMTIVGTVGRDVEGAYQNIRIAEGAKIAGNLSYTSGKDAEIAGTVSGKVTRSEDAQNGSRDSIAAMVWSAVMIVLGMLLIPLVLATAIPKRLHEMGLYAEKQPLRSVLVGFVVFAALPLVITVLLVSGIGVPLALAIMFAAATVMLVSGPVVGYLIGHQLFGKRITSITGRAMLGSVILGVFYLIPLVNILVVVMVLIYGTGAILAYLESRRLFERSSK